MINKHLFHFYRLLRCNQRIVSSRCITPVPVILHKNKFESWIHCCKHAYKRLILLFLDTLEQKTAGDQLDLTSSLLFGQYKDTSLLVTVTVVGICSICSKCQVWPTCQKYRSVTSFDQVMAIIVVVYLYFLHIKKEKSKENDQNKCELVPFLLWWHFSSVSVKKKKKKKEV